MALNLVQFADTAKIASVSAQLQDGNILIASTSTAPKNVSSNSKVKFSSCALISKKDGNSLQQMRKSCDFVAIRGSSPEMCSWAANSKGVDLLLQPFSTEKCFLDLQTANVLQGNNVVVGILFNEFLEADGFRLSQLMKNAVMCVKLCQSAGTKILFFSGAKNESQMRASKDLVSFAVMLGMKKENAIKAARAGADEFAERSK